MRSAKELIEELKKRTSNPYKDSNSYIPVERQLPPPDLNHTFTHLYNCMKKGTEYESRDEKVPSSIIKRARVLLNKLNLDGYRVASFPFTVPFTYAMISYVKVSISAYGNDIGKLTYLDHRMTSREIKDARNEIRKIHDRVHGVDPVNSKSKLILPEPPKLIY